MPPPQFYTEWGENRECTEVGLIYLRIKPNLISSPNANPNPARATNHIHINLPNLPSHDSDPTTVRLYSKMGMLGSRRIHP